jgi:hypothetical protein
MALNLVDGYVTMEHALAVGTHTTAVLIDTPRASVAEATAFSCQMGKAEFVAILVGPLGIAE